MKHVLCLAVAGLLCAATALAQDPVKVDPKHHKVEFEDDHVRVLRITFPPGEKAVTHSHPPMVAVFLTDSALKQNVSSGNVPQVPRKAGEVVWSEAFTHTPENTGSAPIEVVVIEFKPKPAVTKAAAKESPDDSTKLDPKHYKMEMENDHARVIRVRYGPGEKSVMHQHPRLIAINLSGGDFAFTLPDGTTRESPGKPGDVNVMPGESHLPQNRGSSPSEVILVEPK
jgi:quercetin dioxygenase-like cupin family protein